MGKPGIMLYFEICPCLELMTQKEKGDLLDAMLAYGQTEKEPELSGKLQIIWPLIRVRLDCDTKRYDKIVIRNQYATYAKAAKKNNEEKLSYEKWLKIHYPDHEDDYPMDD
jgi:hypothetical protein